MKRRKVMLLIILLSGIVAISGAETISWDSDVRLTNHPAADNIGPNNGWVIAVDSLNRIHVVWSGERDGNKEIYYKRFNGNTWEEDKRLTNASGDSSGPAIAVDGADIIHLIWRDKRNGNNAIRYLRSTDGGITWSNDDKEIIPAITDHGPSIAASGNTVYAFSTLAVSERVQIVSIHSNNNGVSWSSPKQLTDIFSNKENPVGVIGANDWVHVVWQDTRDNISGDRREVYYKRFKDGIWGPDVRLTYDADNGSSDQTIAVDNTNKVHLVWHDDRENAVWDVYYKSSSNGGTTWETTDTRLTSKEDDLHPNHTETDLPSMAVDTNGSVHVIWQDRDIIGEYHRIFYKRYNGSQWEDSIALNNTISGWPSIAVDKNNNIHVIWTDGRDGNAEIYYKKGEPIIINGDINADGEINVLDVQLCVNVILGIEQDADRIKAAKAVAVPEDKCDVLDVQAVVNGVLAE